MSLATERPRLGGQADQAVVQEKQRAAFEVAVAPSSEKDLSWDNGDGRIGGKRRLSNARTCLLKVLPQDIPRPQPLRGQCE